jgi:hypothetical protein
MTYGPFLTIFGLFCFNLQTAFFCPTTRVILRETVARALKAIFSNFSFAVSQFSRFSRFSNTLKIMTWLFPILYNH